MKKTELLARRGSLRALQPRRLLVLPLIALISVALVAVAAAEEPHWDYYSHGGAKDWGHLMEAGSAELAFPDCNLLEQSPVNIEGVRPRGGGLVLAYEPTPLVVSNNGHTIQVNYVSGSMMAIDGKVFSLLQFHFHAPSEHELGGVRADLEAHFVHRARDGEYAVLGVMMVEGESNAAFGEVLDIMPVAPGIASSLRTVNAADLLPADLSHYAYDGSFTTPPCTEGVKWYLLGAPITVLREQIAAFRALDFLHHDEVFVGNARPVQPLNGRLGAESSSPPRISAPSTGSAGLGSLPVRQLGP